MFNLDTVVKSEAFPGNRLPRVFTSPQPIAPQHIFTQHFSLSGDNSDFGLNVNGSVTSRSFRVVCPISSLFFVNSLMFQMVDGSISLANFAGLGTSLTNGLEISLKNTNNDVLLDIVNTPSVKSTFELGRFGTSNINVAALGDDYFFSYLNLADLCGYVPVLTEGQYAEILIQDDLEGLTDFQSVVFGRITQV